jgi:chaperone required for assembly of F1-ATPase
VRDELVKYAGSDLLCYRTEQPEGLKAMQDKAWGDALTWVEARIKARFIVTYHVTFVTQPQDALAAMAGEIARYDGLRLAAFHTLASLMGSVMLALCVSEGHLTTQEAWSVAHVDEEWNNLKWGADEEAEARRARRFVELQAAEQVLRLA